MDTNVSGSASKDPSFFASLSLPPPGTAGEPYSNIATRPGGAPVGSSATAGTFLQKLGVLEQDILEASEQLSSIANDLSSINIAANPTSGGTNDAVQQRHHSLDPANPTAPVLSALVHIADQALQTGNINGLGLTSSLTTQNTSAAATTTAGTTGSQGTGLVVPNPWFAANAYVEFLVNFMDMEKMLMENKMIEGNISLNAQSVIVSLAQDTGSAIMSAAEQQQTQYITQAITSGISMAVTFGSLAMTMGTMSEMETPEEAPSAEGTNEYYQENPDALTDDLSYDDQNTEIINQQTNKPLTKDEVDEQIAQKSAQNKQALEQAKTQRDLLETKIENGEAVAKDDIDEANKTVSKLQKNQEYLESDNLKAYYRNNPEEAGTGTARVKLTGGKVLKNGGEPLTEDDYVNAKGHDSATVKANNERITASNALKNEKIQKYSMISQGIQSGSQMINSAVEAATVIPIAVQQALQKMLEAYSQIEQHVMSSANDFFKNDTDMITQTIQALNTIREKLMSAVTQMLSATR